jgi:lipopolysaccharide biosynthesis glycosyltransferase
MTTIPILFTFDQSLEMPAGICLTSLLENAGKGTFYDIFILHGPQCDFSESRLNELPGKYGNCRLMFRKVEGEFVGGYEIRGIPETAYYRLISPELIPEYDKILYSDVDVIFREDLARYYDIDLGDNYFGAVDTCSVLRPDYQEYLRKEYGYDWHDGYYYSGNLVINSHQLLQDGKLKEFRELGRNQYHQQDMTIINLACKGRILAMTPAYCVSTPLYDLMVNRREEMEALYGVEEIAHALGSGIVHYNGAKPWQGPCPNADIWWAYYRRSIFFDEMFVRDFWVEQRDMLARMPLVKRIKQLVRYPLDRKR